MAPKSHQSLVRHLKFKYIESYFDTDPTTFDVNIDTGTATAKQFKEIDQLNGGGTITGSISDTSAEYNLFTGINGADINNIFKHATKLLLLITRVKIYLDSIMLFRVTLFQIAVDKDLTITDTQAATLIRLIVSNYCS